jgi:hypothetical protein
MKFSDIPKTAVEAIGRYTAEKARKRRERLDDLGLQRQLEQMETLLKEDIKNACAHGFDAVCKVLITAPLSSFWEGTKELRSVISHNLSTKNPKKKKSYSDVPAAIITEFATQWAKGTISAAKMVGNLSLALGRATVLGGRYTIGK